MKIKTELTLPAMLMVCANCQAIDWLFDPSFGVKERYTDNLRMQIKPNRDNFITTISPGIMLGYIGENHELKTNFHWNEIIYHDESELDFSEKIADFNHQFTAERFKTGLSARYAEESSINTQLDLDGNGNLQVQIPKTTQSISPNLTYSLTERDSVQLAYSYLDVAYQRDPQKNVGQFYSDYTNGQVSAMLTHGFSSRFSVNFTGSFARFSTSGEYPPVVSNGTSIVTAYSQESDTFTYQAGLKYAYDERTLFTLSGGIRNTDSTSVTSQTVQFLDFPASSTVAEQTSSASGNVFSAGFNRKYDWGSIDINAGQQLTPASTGGQRDTTSVSLNARYQLDERWSSGLEASYLQSDRTLAQAGNFFSNNRTYMTVTPNIRWRWTEDIDLRLSYSYRQQEYSSVGQAAVGNDVFLQFSYQPQINRQVK